MKGYADDRGVPSRTISRKKKCGAADRTGAR